VRAASLLARRRLKKRAGGAQAQAGLWLRNIQLGLFATPLAAAAMVYQDHEQIVNYGLLQGFDGVVWAVVLLNGCGGLLVAATMKYADNIVKCFAAALAIISGTLLSIPCFGFEPSQLFALGAFFTVLATVLYSWAPTQWPEWAPLPRALQSPSQRRRASADAALEVLEDEEPLVDQSGRVADDDDEEARER